MGWMTQMLAKIIRELTKSDENMMIACEWVLVWAKRIKAWRAQVALINSLSKVKIFDAIWQKDEGKQTRDKTGHIC